MKCNKKAVMNLAWITYRDTNSKPWFIPMSFSECLKSAWKVEKRDCGQNV